MKADFHVHTNFSADSEYEPDVVIKEGIRRGLDTICITDHYDEDYTEPGFTFEPKAYFEKLKLLQEKYRGKIDVCVGIEFGMQAHLGECYKEIAGKYPFDFILCSQHLVEGQDPYYRTYFNDKTDQTGYLRAFEETLQNIKVMTNFDALGHIDYIVRFGNEGEATYTYAECADYIDAILKYLVEHGKALELNTAGWKYGLSFAHPHWDVLRRYRELGGEMITVGSDGHRPEHICYDFHRVADYLESCGFKYYTEFRQRKPYFCALR